MEKLGKIVLNKVTYVPVFLLDNGKKAKTRFELFDIKEAIKKYEAGEEIVTKTVYNELCKALQDIEKLIGKE